MEQHSEEKHKDNLEMHQVIFIDNEFVEFE